MMSAIEMGVSSKSGANGDQGESLKGLGFYKDKPEWKDVQPIDSVDGDDGADPVVSIAYSEKFKDVFSYVWAVISSGELSPRVLDLTGDAIKLDAANYTVWQLRRDVLQALKVPHLVTEAGLGRDFEKEFEFNSEILEKHPKNYQPWQHEKALLSWAIGYKEEVGLEQIEVTTPKILEPVLERELKLTERMLGADPKNYHAWQHRQWILGVFKGFFPSLAAEELAFVKTLLETDVRNNSAWNQRYFVFLDLFGNFSEEALAKEVAETWELVGVALRNESSWSYLRGIINLADPDFRMSLLKEVLSMCKPLLIQTKENCSSVPMTAFYVDVIDELLSAGEDVYIKDYGEAISALDNLSSIDPIRALYWEFVKQKFVAAHAEVAEQKGCCLSS